MSMRYAKTKGQLNKRIDNRIYKPRREAMGSFNDQLEQALRIMPYLVDGTFKNKAKEDKK